MKKWTPEQRSKYYENARLKRAAASLAAGRVPGRVGQPPKDKTAEEKAEYHRHRVAMYYFDNHEKMKEYKREYERKRAAAKAIAEGRLPGKSGPKRKYATNEEYLAARAETRRRYYQANKEKLSALRAKHQRDQRAGLKPQRAAKRRLTLDEKRAAINAASNQRRASILAAGGTYTASDLKILHYRQGGVCEFCHRALGEHDIHVDHWVPLTKGGTNDRDNLRLLHGVCNLKKGVQHPNEFAKSYERMAA